MSKVSNVGIEKFFGILGKKVEDKITKHRGIASSIAFDLYGCIQVVINPGKNKKDGKLGECMYFDYRRLRVLDHKPVMPVPNYQEGYAAEARQGPAIKPAMTPGQF